MLLPLPQDRCDVCGCVGVWRRGGCASSVRHVCVSRVLMMAVPLVLVCLDTCQSKSVPQTHCVCVCVCVCSTACGLDWLW
jgi:hypothetical protein